MRHRTSLITTVTLAVLLASAAPAFGAPTAVAVRCGTTLSGDAYLATDLTCAQGLTISRSLTLDFRGHRLTGAHGTGTAITVTDGTLKVLNGRIDHWNTGINGEPNDDSGSVGSRVLVNGMTLADNGVGLASPGNFIGVPATVFTVDDSTFLRNASGLSGGILGGSFLVTNSTFRNNVSAAGAVEYSSIRLSRSRLVDNETALSCDEAGCTADNSIFQGNKFAVFTTVTGADLKKNVFDRNGTAVSVSSILGSVISSNSFTRNKVGVSLESAAGSVNDNVFLANGLGIGVSDGSVDFELALTQNLLIGNGSGIVLKDAPGTELKNNTALKSKQWGIYAPGAVDKGGNKASGNGRSPQCVGVDCR